MYGDIDDICIEWEERVDNGEIDPETYPLSEYIEDKVSEAIDRAEMLYDMDR